MLAMWAAMFLTAVVGFSAGREWDRCIKRYKSNVRRRREEAERKQAKVNAEMERKEQERSDRFVSYTFYNAPGGY